MQRKCLEMPFSCAVIQGIIFVCTSFHPPSICIALSSPWRDAFQVDGLQQDIEVPLEKLLERYKQMVRAREGEGRGGEGPGTPGRED